MAIPNTIGSFYRPFFNKPTDFSPHKVEILQTTATIINTTTAGVFGSATSSEDFHLLWLTLNYTPATTTAIARAYLGTNIIMQGGDLASTLAATGASYFLHANYGPVGLMGGTTTTHTVSIVAAATLSSFTFVAQGYRFL